MWKTKDIYIIIIRQVLKKNYHFLREIYKLLGITLFKKHYFNKGYTVLSKHKLVYIINSKVACSSIKEHFFRLNGIEICNKYDGKYRNIHYTAKKLKLNKIKLTKEEKNYFIFTLVRNPFERVVSLYRNKIEKPDNDFYEFQRYLMGYIGAEISFEKFVGIICKIEDIHSENHIVSQTYLINKSQKPNFIGKLEQIDDDLNFVFDKHNVPRIKKRSNYTGNYDYRDYYNLKTMNMIYERYKRDFIEFDYQESYLNLEKYLKNKLNN